MLSFKTPVWILGDDHQLELLCELGPVDEEECKKAFSDPRWIASFAKHHRIALDMFGSISVSTVFLGSGRLPFETLLRWHGHEEPEPSDERKYETWQEALDGHEEFCSMFRAAQRRPTESE